jgi:L-aminopeptidase/D-esterase-like protein
MITASFKGGIGSSSRVVGIQDKNYTVGALVQSNYGESLFVCLFFVISTYCFRAQNEVTAKT